MNFKKKKLRVKRHIFRSYSELTFELIVERLKKYSLMGIEYAYIEKKWGIPRKTIYRMITDYDNGIRRNMGKELRVKFVTAINCLDREVERRIREVLDIFEYED